MSTHGVIITVNGHIIHRRQVKPGPKPLPPEIKRRRVNISLDPFWHERGKRLAAEKGISLSKYLEELVYQDYLHKESG